MHVTSLLKGLQNPAGECGPVQKMRRMRMHAAPRQVLHSLLQCGCARTCVAGAVALCILCTLAACDASVAPSPSSARITEKGIEPFVLGESLRAAARQAVVFDKSAENVAPGCSMRDEVIVRVPTQIGHLTLMVMGGEKDDRISEIIAFPDTSIFNVQTSAACEAELLVLARALEPVLGPSASIQRQGMPTFEQLRASYPRADEVSLRARWFQAGDTCDVSLIYLARPDRPAN